MLFSGDEALKPVRVLSGDNCLNLDEPTNHLDLEAITVLNDGLINFTGVLLFTSHDHDFATSIANRIVEICPGGVIDRYQSFDDYLSDKHVSSLRAQYHYGHVIAKI